MRRDVRVPTVFRALKAYKVLLVFRAFREQLVLKVFKVLLVEEELMVLLVLKVFKARKVYKAFKD